MIGVDANLLLRLILDDDSEQRPVVDRLLADSEDGGIYVGVIVIAELSWVLKRAYKESPETILDIIESLLHARQFTVERSDLVWAALSDARAARCGIADSLIARVAHEAGADATLTFDIRAKRLPTMLDAKRFTE